MCHINDLFTKRDFNGERVSSDAGFSSSRHIDFGAIGLGSNVRRDNPGIIEFRDRQIRFSCTIHGGAESRGEQFSHLCIRETVGNLNSLILVCKSRTSDRRGKNGNLAGSCFIAIGSGHSDGGFAMLHRRDNAGGTDRGHGSFAGSPGDCLSFCVGRRNGGCQRERIADRHRGIRRSDGHTGDGDINMDSICSSGYGAVSVFSSSCNGGIAGSNACNDTCIDRSTARRRPLDSGSLGYICGIQRDRCTNGYLVVAGDRKILCECTDAHQDDRHGQRQKQCQCFSSKQFHA